MGYYDNILNLISLVLAMSILFIILFGCQFQKYRYVERFTDATPAATTPAATTPAATTPAATTPAATTPAATTTETTDDDKTTKGTVKSLKPFEAEILNELNKGNMKPQDIEKLIDNGTFTRENLDSMIAYIQHFRNMN
jgi:3-oxoacyl-ACP reductase-like protein